MGVKLRLLGVLCVFGASAGGAGCQGGPGPVTLPGDFGPGFSDIGAGLRAAPPCTPLTLDQVQFGEPTATTALIADVDGDGRAEVIASCAGDNVNPAPTAVAYRYDAAAGALVPAPALLPAGVPALVGVLDLDGDGHPDLLAMRPELAVAWGRAGGGFEPFAPLVASEGSWRGLSFADVDGDGWLDAVVGDRACAAGHRDLSLLLRTGPRSFARRDTLVTPASPVQPYGAFAIAGPPGRGETLLTLGSACFGDSAPGFYAPTGRAADGAPTFTTVDPLPADAWPRDHGGPGAAATLADYAPMAAATGDLDGDGLEDLVVTLDPSLEILQGRPQWPFADASRASGVLELDAPTGLPEIPWGLAIADVDGDGRPDLVVAHGYDEGAWRDPARQIGPQRVSVDWNTGGLRFGDAGHALHVDAPGQWRSVAVGDLDGDGDPDLAIGGMGRLPAIYRNDVDRGNHGFGLVLVGTASNRLGLGAEVEVWPAGGGALRRYTVPRTTQWRLAPAPEIFVGLGRATSADRARITWPTGVVQVVHDLAAGADHRVVEPPLFTLDPASRHLPADGHSALVVTVHPRNPDGTVRAGAQVSVKTAGGTAVTPSATDTLPDGSVAVHLVAPTTAGSSRLEITVDGVVSPIHPRVWWE